HEEPLSSLCGMKGPFFVLAHVTAVKRGENMQARVEEVRAVAKERIAAANALPELERVQVEVLGKKGLLTQLLRSMGSIPPNERPAFGKLVNAVRDELEKELHDKRQALQAVALDE